MNAEVEERDFFKAPFSEGELRELARGRKISDVFSWKSPSFKALGLKPEDLSEYDLLRLMLQEPRMIRRPITQIGGELIIGADTEALETALSS